MYPPARATATQAIGIILPTLPTPLMDGCMGHSDAALEQKFLHIAVAQGEAVVQAAAVANDLAGRTVVCSVPCERAESCRLPMLGLAWTVGDHHRGHYVMSWKRGATT